MAIAEKKVKKSASEVKKVAKKRKYKKAVTAAKAKAIKKRSWNFVNSWKYGNKKERYDVTVRIGTFTLFEVYYCPCDRNGCKRFRLMLFNFGVEL
jgi:hypothetical protein